LATLLGYNEKEVTVITMPLKHDPLNVFVSSRTPAGLYARQKWLGQGETDSWKKDFHFVVSGLLAGQARDGSWNHSFWQTAHRLFGLHLTVRERSEPVTRALEWLVKAGLSHPQRHAGSFPETEQQAFFQGVPFSPGRLRYLVPGVVLFLASIFGYEQDKRILEEYRRLAVLRERSGGPWCGRSCSNNILRAFVVHPVFSRSRAVELTMGTLAACQDTSGRWARPVPFFQTVNALAHLSSTQAEKQLGPAFERLRKTQNRDGTWGKNQKAWNTFLVVHAFISKGILRIVKQ
jgi:hypothetical protein